MSSSVINACVGQYPGQRLLQGVLEHTAAIAVYAGVFALRFEIGATDFDGFQFIAADPAGEDFFFAGYGVEKPFIITTLPTIEQYILVSLRSV